MTKRAMGRQASGKRKSNAGRPTDYRPEYAEQAQKLAKLGATDADLASFFKVAISTIYRWRAFHPEFSEATKLGKDEADDAVERALYARATGYSHDAVKIFQHEGRSLVVPFVEHYAPDTAAAFIWLKNRRPQQWRDRPVGDGGDDDMARARRIKAALAEIEDAADGAAG